MNLNWLMRMSLWARRPASAKRVKLVLIVVGLCLAIVIFEKLFGWPDWLTTNGRVRPRVH